MVSQKKEVISVLNIDKRVDQANDLSFQGFIQIKDTKGGATILQTINDDNRLFLLDSSKHKFETQLDIENYPAYTSYLSAKENEIIKSIGKQISPQLEVYFINSKVSDRRIAQIFKDTIGWSKEKAWQAYRFNMASDEFIPSDFKILSESASRLTRFSFNIKNSEDNIVSRSIDVNYTGTSSIFPKNYFLSFKSMENRKVIIKLSINCPGSELSYLKIINNLNGASYSITNFKFLGSRSKKYQPDFNYGYCVELFYLAEMGFMENN